MQWEPYRPGDDTFFLLDAVEKNDVKGKKVLEFGCGTCYIINRLAALGARLAVGCDLMPSREGQGADVIRCDARRPPFRNNGFDLVLFNPPYLPSEGISDVAVDGGRGGADVPLAFLASALNAVRPGGAIYFVVSSLTDTAKIEGFLNRAGLRYARAERRLFFESLYVYEVLVGQSINI